MPTLSETIGTPRLALILLSCVLGCASPPRRPAVAPEHATQNPAPNDPAPQGPDTPVSFAPRQAFQLASPIVEDDGELFDFVTTVRLRLGFPDAELRYTLDGSEPGDASPLFEAPLHLTRSATLRARSFAPGWRPSDMVEREYRRVPTRPRSVIVDPEPAAPYEGRGVSTLTDGSRGSDDFRDGNWLGFQGPVTLLVEPGAAIVRQVVLGVREDVGSWIFLPSEITASTSSDGDTFVPWQTCRLAAPSEATAPRRLFLTLTGEPIAAPWIRIRLTPVDPLPAWHPGHPGGRSWIFLDEIIVEGGAPK